jgi:anhydro-N-acetylmuramic acid kinase
MKKYNVIGLMSGTSLDGLDIAATVFKLENGRWSFDIMFSHTYPYSSEWKDKLSGLPSVDALTFSYINVEYGHLLGRLTRSFIENTGFQPEFIASHGHTIFHQPAHGLTVQIGAGSAIAAETGLPVICDFRSTDVALGGQGAPLVPAGDRLLFSQYAACLNLGGFANISMEWNGQRIAYDICPCNIILNKLANQLGKEYDKDGEIARSGCVDSKLLNRLNQINYYKEKWPKSLGREWLEETFIPVIDQSGLPVADAIATVCEHIAVQVDQTAVTSNKGEILVTGGGAHHTYLIEKISKRGQREYIIPPIEITDYKEAVVFAFLGLLRWRNEPNIFRSVTGSSSDHSGGAIYLPG